MANILGPTGVQQGMMTNQAANNPILGSQPMQSGPNAQAGISVMGGAVGSDYWNNNQPPANGGYDGGGINPGGMYSGGNLSNDQYVNGQPYQGGPAPATPPIAPPTFGQGPAPAGGTPAQLGQPTYNTYQPVNTGTGAPLPQYGLSGYENAITSGLGASIGAINAGGLASAGALNTGLNTINSTLANAGTAAIGQINQGLTSGRTDLQSGITGLDPYAQTGKSANQRQAALSGVLGPEAQAEAFAGFNESPGQQYLREQAEKSLLRNSGAMGGLGGGRVRLELEKQAIGLAQQDYQNQFNNMGTLSDRGATAATNQANIYNNMANLSQSGSRNIADIIGNVATGSAAAQGNTSTALANLYQQTGQNKSNLYSGAGSNIAGARQQAGRDIATAIDGTATALDNLQSSQGAGLADIIGQDAVNIINLMQSGATLTAEQQTTLATALANISTGNATNIGRSIIGGGLAQAGGITGGAAAVDTGLGNLGTALGDG